MLVSSTTVHAPCTQPAALYSQSASRQLQSPNPLLPQRMMRRAALKCFGGSEKPEEEVLMPIVSKRGKLTASYNDFLYNKAIEVCNNVFHPEENPEGTVNLGTAVNCLMTEEVCARINQGDALVMKPIHLHYFNFAGNQELRDVLAQFLNRHFEPLKPITPDQLSTMSGATSCLDGLAHVLCDSGDVAITPTPVYARIQTDFLDVANVKVEPLNLLEEDDFSLKPEALEERIKELRAKGHRVRAFILLNPQNPLGEVYPPALLAGLLDVCARHQVHVIVDEIYALSVIGDDVKFRSVLTLDLPDPERTHVVWAMSKDFGLVGMRVGVVISQCADIHTYFKNACLFRPVPSILQDAAVTLFRDTAWCDEVYLPTYRKRLTHQYRTACERLEGMGLSVRKASGGLFVWFSIKPFLQPLTWEEESGLLMELLDAGVYLVTGSELYCSSPGWARLVFTVTWAALDEGLNRLKKVLMGRRERQGVNGP